MSYKLKTLQNGLRLLTVPLKGSHAATVLVLAKVGSRHESRAINGVSHFLEHLMFKGTKKRPTTQHISKQLDAVGAEYNAFTSKDHTGYYIKIAGKKLRLALDMLSDMLQHSKFDLEEINRERNVIVEEINMYEDNPMMFVEELLEEMIFGKGTPLGQLIAGPRSVIRRVKRPALMDYLGEHYTARNMLVVVSGSAPSHLDRHIERYFSDLPRRRAPAHQPAPIRKQSRPQVSIVEKKTEQVQVCLGWPALPYGHPDMHALSLLNVILGGNMSSRLFTRIRERQGLCYFIRSGVNPYEDAGAFVIQSGLDKSRLAEALRSILAEITLIARKEVSGDELDKAREFVRGKMMLQFEDSEALAAWYGRQAIFRQAILTPEQRYLKLKRVTPKQIRRLAAAILKKHTLSVAIIGPVKSQQRALEAICRNW